MKRVVIFAITILSFMQAYSEVGELGKIYTGPGEMYSITAEVKQIKDSAIIEFCIYNLEEKKSLTIDLGYKKEYPQYMQFLSQVLKKSVEWMQTAKSNNITDLSKELPITAPNVDAKIYDGLLIKMVQNYTRPTATFKLIPGISTPYIYLTHSVTDSTSKQYMTFSCYMPLTDLLNIVKMMDTTKVQNAIQEINTNNKNMELFK